MKFLIKTGILFLGLYLGTYVFNHYNAWLGILIIIATVLLILYLIFKKK